MVGVWPLSVSVWVFTDPAEEVAKATGVCVTGRPVGVCERSMERPLSGLQGKADTKGPEEESRKAGVGLRDDLTPVDCLFLRRAAEGVGRCCSHNVLGCVGLSLDTCTPCEHLDKQIKSHIVRFELSIPQEYKYCPEWSVRFS